VNSQAGRVSVPSRHPPNQSERSRTLIANADVILGLEVWDFWGTVHSFRDQLQRTWQPITKEGVKLVSITAGDLYTKSNYQDFERYPEVDLAIAADAEATLPSLIEACKRLIGSDRKRAFEDRGKRLAVNIQNDGDLMYAPGVLWTSAHHRIPLLSVMHNNRAYHQEVMHLQRMANRHQRGITRAGIGTTIEDPNIDYAMVARGLGLHAEGPITEPKDLGPALRRAAEAVTRGEMALVDVVTQPR